ncbi:Uncharacterised protein [uncultured archaeon]|nr:Uncharacterised protein [uncultured archaeon]
MADLGVVHDGAVLDLHGVAHPHIVADAARGPDVAVGAYPAVLSDDHRAFDVGSGHDQGILAYRYLALQGRSGLDLSQNERLHFLEQYLICLQDIPGPADLQPALQLHNPDLLLICQKVQAVGQLILAARRRMGLRQRVEDASLQRVNACIGQVRWGLFALLHHGLEIALLLQKDAVPFRVRDLDGRHRVLFGVDQVPQGRYIRKHIPVEHQEALLCLGFRCQQSVAGAELLILDRIIYPDA